VDVHLSIPTDPQPHAGHYFGSHHFSLARLGVPAFSMRGDMKCAGQDTQWGEDQARDFVEHRYHQPSDEYSPDMDFTGDAVIARFGFVLGSKAAWQPTLAGWLSGDEFEAARKQSLQ